MNSPLFRRLLRLRAPTEAEWWDRHLARLKLCGMSPSGLARVRARVECKMTEVPEYAADDFIDYWNLSDTHWMDEEE